MVRLLSHRNGLGTLGGQITHTQKLFGYTHRGGKRNGPITHTSWSGYNAWSGYSRTERVWVQWLVRSILTNDGFG